MLANWHAMSLLCLLSTNSCALDSHNAISSIHRILELLLYRCVIRLFTFLCDIACYARPFFSFIHSTLLFYRPLIHSKMIALLWKSIRKCFMCSLRNIIPTESKEWSNDGMLSTCMEMNNSIKCGISFCSAIVHALIGKQIIIYTCTVWKRVLRWTEDDWWFNMDKKRVSILVSILLLSFHSVLFGIRFPRPFNRDALTLMQSCICTS